MDVVQGGDDDDTLFGGADADIVDGQLGTDQVAGGSGNDDAELDDAVTGSVDEIDEAFQLDQVPSWVEEV